MALKKEKAFKSVKKKAKDVGNFFKSKTTVVKRRGK